MRKKKVTDATTGEDKDTSKETVAQAAKRFAFALENTTAELAVVAKELAAVKNIQAMNLWQKISAVRDEITTVRHNKTVGDGKFAYDVTTHEAIRELLRPLMAKYHLVDFIRLNEMVEADTGLMRGGNDSKRKLIQYKGNYTYVIVDADTTGSLLNIENVLGYGEDAGDKGPGKSNTYALKQAQKTLFLISTGDDGEEDRLPDGHTDTQQELERISPEQVEQIIYTADKYFKGDSEARLRSMCDKAFASYNVSNVTQIPAPLFDQAMRLLKRQAVRDGIIAEDDPTKGDDDVT
jgi:hypothetical protein